MPTYGLTGAVNAPEYAVLESTYAVDYSIGGDKDNSAPDWRVTVVTGVDRTVSVAAGTGGGRGALDVATAATSLQGGIVTAGARWDTVVQRRVWAVGTTPASSTLMLLPGGPTRAISTQRVVNPGVQDDQPIALVQFTTAQLPQAIVDLRCWAGNRGLVVRTVDALAYLKKAGTRVYVMEDNTTRTCIFGANDTLEWHVERHTPPVLVASGTAERVFVSNTNLPVRLAAATFSAPFAGQPVQVSFTGVAQAGANTAGNVWITLNGGTLGGKRRIRNIAAAGVPVDASKSGHGVTVAGANEVRVFASTDLAGEPPYFYDNQVEVWA